MIKKFSSASAALSLALICLASFSLMFWASRTDSAITDELAHIPAGYGYVHNLDYRLNPEHPPLVKALAMLPVLILNPSFPTQLDAWQTEVNAQWDMGYQFLYQFGNDATAIIRTSRIMPMLLTILVIILIYLFAAGLMGAWWALLPAFLFAFSPSVLAHGHYVTTDIGAAFGTVLATYFFLKYVDSPTTKHLWYAGLAFGAAQISKFSMPLLVPLFVFLMGVLWLREVAMSWGQPAIGKIKKLFFSLCRRVWKLILIGVIGYALIVYPVYFLFTANYPVTKQVSDTTEILTSFGGGPTPVGQMCHGLRCLADIDIKMAGNPVLHPIAQYMLGVLMVIQRSDGGNTIYYLGEVRGSGGWTYFPVLYLLKETIPTLIIVLLALGLALWGFGKKIIKTRGQVLRSIIDYLGVNFAEFSMASFIVFYWGYSMRSPLNIGIRHLMPTIPFIYILASGVWKKWITNVKIADMGASLSSMLSGLATTAKSLFTSSIKYGFLIVLLVWLALETTIAAPYFLSYFNEFGGGVNGGYRFVTDSNYDWGQDLLRLQAFVNAHPEIDKIAVDYFGGGNPKYYLGNKAFDWNSSKGIPTAAGIHWLVISVNQLQGDTQPLAPGQNRNEADSYPWLTSIRPAKPGMGNVPPPDFRVGTSLFVYHL